MNIESIVISWDRSKEQYTLTALTNSIGLVTNTAKNMEEIIEELNKLEENYAT